MCALGLSPPRRGNQRDNDDRAVPDGSIPAQAGEPRSSTRPPARPAVYPRPSGGTGRWLASTPTERGLSPPKRGNPAGESEDALRLRSIPAQAGEPACDGKKRACARVYPRPSGGTRTSSLDAPSAARTARFPLLLAALGSSTSPPVCDVQSQPPDDRQAGRAVALAVARAVQRFERLFNASDSPRWLPRVAWFPSRRHYAAGKADALRECSPRSSPTPPKEQRAGLPRARSLPSA